jgi:hypothetical protein
MTQTPRSVQKIAVVLGVDCRAFANPDLKLPEATETPRCGRPPKAGAADAPKAPAKKRGQQRKGKE